MSDVIKVEFPIFRKVESPSIIDPVEIDEGQHGKHVVLLPIKPINSDTLQDRIVSIVDNIIDMGIDKFRELAKNKRDNIIPSKNKSKEHLRGFTTEIWNQAFAEGSGMQDTFEYIRHENVNFPEEFIIKTIARLLDKYRESTYKTLLGIHGGKLQEHQSIQTIDDPDILLCINNIIDDGINLFIATRSDEYTPNELYSRIRVIRKKMEEKTKGIVSLFQYIEQYANPTPIELVYKKEAIEYSLSSYKKEIYDYLRKILPQK